MFATALEPKKLVTDPGGHFETYIDHVNVSGYAVRDWFVQHMATQAAA